MNGQRLDIQVPDQNPQPIPLQPNQGARPFRRPLRRMNPANPAEPAPPPNYPAFNYDNGIFDPKDHERSIKKLKKYKMKGMFCDVKIGEETKQCKISVECGYEKLYLSYLLKIYKRMKNDGVDEVISEKLTIDELLKQIDVLKKDDKIQQSKIPPILVSDEVLVREHTRTLYVSSECLLKVHKYTELFESILWTIIGESKIKPTQYLEEVWHVYNPGNIQPVRGNPVDVIPTFTSNVKKYYDMLNIPEISWLRILYFRETFQLLINKMRKHIVDNFHVKETLDVIGDELDAYIGCIILLYGKRHYYAIMENIDELLQFMTPDCIFLMRSYSLKMSVYACWSSIKCHEKNDNDNDSD